MLAGLQSLEELEVATPGVELSFRKKGSELVGFYVGYIVALTGDSSRVALSLCNDIETIAQELMALPVEFDCTLWYALFPQMPGLKAA